MERPHHEARTWLKARYGLKMVLVSNEGRELNAYRIRKFRLAAFVDEFISSCFVHVSRPERVGESVGIRSILHTDFRSTSAGCVRSER